jgi:hypothetical protein
MEMKGQFFLLGAVLLIVTFYIALPLFQPMQKSELGFVARNIANEYIKVANFGLPYVINWSEWIGKKVDNFSSIWLFAIGNGSHVNLTIGNWLGKNITVALNISGNLYNLFVKNASINWTSFSSNEQFNITINWTESRQFSWLRDKNNFWALVTIEQAKDKFRAEVEG